MFGLRDKERKILTLQTRCANERALMAGNIYQIMPTVSKVRRLSTYQWVLKLGKPLLRGAGFSLAKRVLLPRGRHKLLKLLGLGAIGVGAWQLLDHAGED